MGMSDESANKSNAGGWITGVVAALVLYVLSFGPVAGLYMNSRIPESAVLALAIIYMPLSFLEKTPLKVPMEGYLRWWEVLLAKP
jgi:hypothetical protein